MKKTERINLIMRYINNRRHFTIAELQKEFQISRATAIRDIQEIETLGFPLTSEVGRGGGYDVLHNDYLPALHFTPDELRALVISFLASKNSQLPFLKNRQSITEKLIAIASQSQQDELIDLADLLLFENTNPANPSLLELDDAAPSELNELLRLSIKDRHLQLSYENIKGDFEEILAYVLHFYNSDNQWLLEIYDFRSSHFRTLAISQIKQSKTFTEEIFTDTDRIEAAPLSADEIKDLYRQAKSQINLQVELDASAIRRFKRLHPPGTLLQYTAMFQSRGFFSYFLDCADAKALDEMADWLLFLGTGISFKQAPEVLKQLLKQKLSQFLEKV